MAVKPPVVNHADEERPPAAAPPMSLARLLFVRIPYLIGGALLLAAIAINMANVIGRYVFAAPVFSTAPGGAAGRGSAPDRCWSSGARAR